MSLSIRRRRKLGKKGLIAPSFPYVVGQAFSNIIFTVTPPDTTSDNLVDSLTTQFSLDIARIVRISVSLIGTYSGGVTRLRFRLYDGNTQLTSAAAQTGTGGDYWFAWQGASGENNNQEICFMEFRALSAGPHTINVKASYGATFNVNWGERSLVAEVVS